MKLLKHHASIAIRVNAGSSVGFGHMKRCLRLAKQLNNLGYLVTFLVDKVELSAHGEFNNFIFHSLYGADDCFSGEHQDAKLFLKKIKSISPVCVIVDDYRISKEWETLVRKNYPLIVFDDENKRAHECDILIDSNWRGEATALRYLNLVPANAQRLLGPQYAILGDGSKPPANDSKIQFRIKQPSVLLSLGGGGDMRVLQHIVQAIIDHSGCKPDIPIQVVIGPCATNSEYLLKYAEKNSQIVPIIGQDNLDKFFMDSSLYVGSSGTTLYEALVHKLPSISFSLAENQKYDQWYLEELGHYFHFNDFDSLAFEDLAELIWLAMDQIEKLTMLYKKKPKVQMDGEGALRIANKIHELMRSLAGDKTIPIQDGIDLIDYGNDVAGDEVVRFKEVGDELVNAYLSARRYPRNGIAITDTNKIHALNHYIWWLKRERQIYSLFRGSDPRVYCWHQMVQQDEVYIKGGFFAASEDATGVEIIKAVLEHHRLTDKQHPLVQWYAITHKGNTFASALNRRLGFIELEKRPEYFQLFSKVFGCFNFEEYIFYRKPPVML